MWNLKNKRANETKSKQTHKYREQIGGCTGDGAWRMAKIAEGDYNLTVMK